MVEEVMVVVARVVVPDTMSVVMAAFVVVALVPDKLVKLRPVAKKLVDDPEVKLSMVAKRLVEVALTMLVLVANQFVEVPLVIDKSVGLNEAAFKFVK